MDQTAGSNKITLGTTTTPARAGRANTERIDEIRQNIEQTRNEITDTVDQLGEKLKETVDWRSYVTDHPFIAVGGAALIGFYLTRKLLKPKRSNMEALIENLIRTGRDALAPPPRKSLIATVLTLAGKYAWEQYQNHNEEQTQQQQQDEQVQAFQAAYQQLLMQQQQSEEEVGFNQPPAIEQSVVTNNFLDNLIISNLLGGVVS